MRKGGEEQRAFRGSELELLEEENVDWERIWSRSVAGDALPSSLGELRCVSTPHISASHGSSLSFQTGRRAYDHNPDGQRPSRLQSGIVIVVYSCD